MSRAGSDRKMITQWPNRQMSHHIWRVCHQNIFGIFRKANVSADLAILFDNFFHIMRKMLRLEGFSVIWPMDIRSEDVWPKVNWSTPSVGQQLREWDRVPNWHMLSWLNSVSFRQVLKSKFTGAESKLTFDEMIRRHLKLSKQKLSLAFSLRERERWWNDDGKTPIYEKRNI